jgi:glutamate-1-semialdehyde 2,1-aminomutase
MGLGPLLLGHRPPEVTAAVAAAIHEYGTVFGLPYELEAEAAKKVADAVPSVDMVRFANSGSEAVGTAIRLARAVTGRKLIVKFEGHYHGWLDTVYWSNHPDPSVAGDAGRPAAVPAGKGLLPEVADSLVILSWNDPESFTRLMDELGEQVAAVITEPVMLNTGCILPEPGWLEVLRSATKASGALLIFDEVITGFRFARGGGQEHFGVMPDITTMAKGLGGGFPVAAIGGTREVMEAIGDGRYSHSGTYNSNVIQTAAVSATMDLLTPERYAAARALGTSLMDGLAGLLAAHGVPSRVVGLGTVFQVWMGTDEPIRNWRDAERLADEALFTRWWRAMMDRGVLFHPAQFENLFFSLAHTQADVDRTLEAAEGALGAL